tara:strand:- start:167 stop:622 length:456 start_codon:yes stop_codon:yes gene_type:complete
MIPTDVFSLATAALAFAGSFGSKGDPKGGGGGMDTPSKSTTGSSFLDFDFLKSGAKALVKSQDKKSKPFKSAEFPKTRPVSQLTNPKPFRPVGDMRFITGAENADIQNAMRLLSNSTNRDIVRLMPVDVVSPVRKQTQNILIGSSTLGKIE